MRQRTLWSFGRAYKGGKMLLPSGWRRPDSLEASTYHYTHTLAAHPITHSVRQINTSETHTGKKSLRSSSVALESLLFICLLNASSSDLTHKVILLQLLQTGAQRFQQSGRLKNVYGQAGSSVCVSLAAFYQEMLHFSDTMVILNLDNHRRKYYS